MRKLSFYCSGLLLMLAQHIHAQSVSVDKTKVMEYFQNQQYEEAVSFLSPLLNADSTNIQLLSLLGYANYMNDNIPAARKNYSDIISIDSNNLTANQYLAIINNNKPEQAIPFVRRLITQQPSKATHYRNMAELLKKLNEKDSSLSYYNKAYELAPGDYKNAAGLADALIEKKNYSRADSILDASLAKDSINIACLKIRIRSAYEAKDYQSILVPGERFIRQGEISLSALTQIALSYYNLKMYADCIRVCDFMLNNDLSVESVYYYQAKSYAKLKEYAKSNDLLQVCVSKAISANAEMYYYALGENYEFMNQFKTAVTQYDTAYYLFKDPLMKYYAGRIFESELKNEKLERKYYSQYLQLAKPQSPDEKKAYVYVRERLLRPNKK
ncbi:MAG: hypothetical protein QM726_07225 [Chitinophagaceae bacterium]